MLVIRGAYIRGAYIRGCLYSGFYGYHSRSFYEKNQGIIIMPKLHNFSVFPFLQWTYNNFRKNAWRVLRSTKILKRYFSTDSSNVMTCQPPGICILVINE